MFVYVSDSKIVFYGRFKWSLCLDALSTRACQLIAIVRHACNCASEKYGFNTGLTGRGLNNIQVDDSLLKNGLVNKCNIYYC